MTLSAFRTVGGIKKWRSCRDARYFLGIMLQALVDPRSITSAAVEIGIKLVTYIDMRRLTTGIRTEERVIRRFRRRANVIECTYTNLDYNSLLHT
jgi:hypothetical protein